MEKQTENQESQKPVIVDPEEFGLTIKKGSEIEGTFSPLKTEYDALLKVYELIVNSEITPEVCERARRCRIDAGKQIKKVSDVHKVEKAVFWNGGLFVDAIKNRDTLLLELIKNGAKKIEDTYHIIELERIEKVRIKRTKELSQYTTEIPESLGAMRLQIYDNYLAGAIAIYKAKVDAEIKAETERFKAEKAEVLHKERKEELLHYWGFVPLGVRGMNFSELTEDEWQKMRNHSIGKQKAHDAKQEVQRVENELLKKQADEKERLAKIESDKRAKVEADRIRNEKIEREKIEKIETDRLEKERLLLESKVKKEIEAREQSAIKFLVELGFKEDPAFGYRYSADGLNCFIGSFHYSDLQTDKELDMFKADASSRIEKQKLKVKQEKAEAELKATKDAELKKLADELAEKEADLSKGDADKINDLISDLEALMTKYSFKSKTNQAKYLGVIKLISKVISYIEG